VVGHCGEGQTERRACALFTEREVSFRVEASARTMTKESLNGNSYYSTSTNLIINGRDYLPWPVLVTLSR
jgi:hypothetical protein